MSNYLLSCFLVFFMWKKSHGVRLLGFLACDNNIFIQRKIPFDVFILNNIMVLYDFKNTLLLSFGNMLNTCVGGSLYIYRKERQKKMDMFV